MATSKAAAALKKAVSPQTTQEQVAEACGVTQQAVSNWVNGVARPKPENMATIEQLLGIPMRDWTEPAEEANGSAA